MAGEHLVRLLQIAGAALGIPAAAAGTFAAYQNYFSTDVTCQKLRNDIMGIMERNVDPNTKRSLLKKDVTEFDKLCGEVDPDARAIFQAAMSEHPAQATHAAATSPPVPIGASSPRAPARAVAVPARHRSGVGEAPARVRRACQAAGTSAQTALARQVRHPALRLNPAITWIAFRSRARGGRDFGPQSAAAAASREDAHAGAARQAALQLTLIVGAGLRLGPDRQHRLGG